MNENALIDAWNSREIENILALYTENATRHQFAFPEARLEGKAAIREAVGAILHACPDAGLTGRSRHVGDDGRIVQEWMFTGTLENDFGPLRANGARITLPGIAVLRVDSEGLIVSENVYWDTATLMAAAEFLPGVGAAAG